MFVMHMHQGQLARNFNEQVIKFFSLSVHVLLVLLVLLLLYQDNDRNLMSIFLIFINRF